MALVLAETAAGGTALLWLTGLWGAVKRGYFILTTSVMLGCALLATLAASAAVVADERAVRVAVLLAAATAVLLGLSLSSLIVRADRAGVLLGWAAAAAAAATLVGFARVAGPGFGSALIQVTAGAAFMGAVTDGLLLGHWYLVDRRLPREHIQRYAVILIAAVAVEAVAVAVLGFGGRAAVGFSLFLQIAGLATWLALGMVACTALIAVLIRATLRGGGGGRAVQAATGFFYLAVITAFTAEMAAKIGFLQ